MSSIGYMLKEGMKLASEVTQLEKNRGQFIKRSLIGFAVWQLAYLFHYLHVFTLEFITIIVTTISLIGAIVWAYYLVKIVLLSVRMQKQRQLAMSLNNEYYQLLRLKSFAAGFWILLVAIGVSLVLGLYVELNPRLLLHVLLVIGVIGALAGYLILDKDEALDDE